MKKAKPFWASFDRDVWVRIYNSESNEYDVFLSQENLPFHRLNLTPFGLFVKRLFLLLTTKGAHFFAALSTNHIHIHAYMH